MSTSAAAQDKPVGTGIETAYIWFDGQLVPKAEAKTSVLNHALHYGSSVFEGIRAYETSKGPAIFRLNEHTKRLLESAKIFDMKVSMTEDEINYSIIQTVKKNGYGSCYIRPLFWYGGDSLGVCPQDNEVHFMVATMPWGTYLGDEAVQKGARLMTSSWRRSPGDVLATKAKIGGNYVNSILANQEAKANGFDEALLLDKEGYIAEGSGENIFFVNEGILYPIVHSINLRGLTRDSVVRIAKWLEVVIEPTMATRDELYTADEVFMVGTAAEVTPIAAIDGRPIGQGKAGEFALKLRKIYLDVVTGKIPEFEDWLTYVS